MSVILQDEIPYDVTMEKSLPGVAPLGDASWLHLDEANAAQLTRKAELLAERRAAVVALDAGGLPAAPGRVGRGGRGWEKRRGGARRKEGVKKGERGKGGGSSAVTGQERDSGSSVSSV